MGEKDKRKEAADETKAAVKKDVFDKRKGLKIGSFLVLMFFLLYIPSFFHWIFAKDINTDIIKIGSIEDSINADGYIIRSEEVLKSPFDGKYITDVGEGGKIPANSRVATVLGSNSEKLLNDLKQLDIKIIKAQKEKSEAQGLFSEDTEKIDSEIGQKVQLVINEGNANNLNGTAQLKEQMDGLLQKKAVIIGSISPSDASINSLKKQKESLQAEIKLCTREIISQSPGIISYTVDGYENTLNPAAIMNLTPKVLEEIKLGKSENLLGKNTVQSGKPFARVIKDFEYYVVFALDASEASKFKVDDGIDIRINDINKTVDASVEYKSDKIDGKYIIALKADKCAGELSSLRKINMDLIKRSYKGFKVPLNSLRDIDKANMKAKIVIVAANYAAIKDVAILGMNGDYAIIDNPVVKGKSDGQVVRSNDGISLYNTYVTNPVNIQEGQLINQ